MSYGDAKIKDIAEGILPAKRKAARAARHARRRIHQAGRARSRQELLAGDDGSQAATLERHAIVRQMWRRRGSDNLSALFRWAERSTRHLDDPEERYLAVQAVLPRNLIGRHALSHIADLDGFRRPGDDPNQRWHYRRETPAERTARLVAAHQRLVDALVVLAGMELGAVNAWLKAHPACPKPRGHRWGEVCECRPRLLAGVHDVDAFARAVPAQAEAVVRALG